MQNNNNEKYEQIEEFKTQLRELLISLPPLIDIITIQNNAETQLAQLYQVFSSNEPYMYTNTNQINVLTSHNKDNNTIEDTASDVDEDMDLFETNENISLFQIAKIKMINLLQKNVDYRCKKIIESLNKTTKNDPNLCVYLKHFELNEKAKTKILKNISLQFKEWKGGNYKEKLKTEQEYFKKVRAHWNRQKSHQLGDKLFFVVLQNLFENVLQIDGLSQQKQVVFYIDLFCDLLKEKIQFNQSMPRPLIPNACFDKASQFKRLCENILQIFGRGNIKWTNIRTTKSVRNTNGVTVTKYVKNAMRSQILADSYYKCLKDIKSIILNESNDFMQHSIQMHINWMHKTLAIHLIEWQPLIINNNNNNNNNGNYNNYIPISCMMTNTTDR